MKSDRLTGNLLARLGTALALLGTGALLAACSIGVDPWDRDLMAKKSMQLNPNPLVTEADDHIHFAKEGSSGGRTFDGGGCGCN